MKYLSSDKQADVIKAFNSTSRYLDNLLNIDNSYFEGMVNQIYPPELQLNKANTSDTEAPCLDFFILSISNGFVSSKIYDKRDDFVLDIVNMVMFHFVLLTEYISLSSYDLLEYVVMLMTLILVINA